MSCVSSPLLQYHSSSIAYAAVSKPQSDRGPTIKDHNLKAEIVFRGGGGLKFPTSMAFLGSNDILVLENNEGTVKRIVNGVMLPEPLLDVNVATKGERCMCGIAVVPNNANRSDYTRTTYIFLYYTEALYEDGGNALGNRLYRYELVGNKLVNPKLLLDLPATPGPVHNGGAIMVGPDGKIYVPIGDVHGHNTKAKNFIKGPGPDGTGGILRVTQDGKPIGNGILGNKYPLNLYYAYGIRNSFGIDFDPITKKLWDTENGPSFGDEINLIEPGFNSGWNKVQGVWAVGKDQKPGNVIRYPHNLVTFGGRGKYSPPDFTWNSTPGLTALKFLSSDKLGKQYQNDMFVGDFHRGNLYHFELNEERTGLSLKGPLLDKVADTDREVQNEILGTGFGGITDIQVGPDGYLYIVSLSNGTIYKLVTANKD